jgi:polar amino acid transport system substrate-binding protein
MEVQAGTSDAAIIDLLMALAMTGEGTSYDNLVFTFTLNDEQYGVAFRQGSDLAAELNQFFADKYADGTLDNLAEIYGLAGSVIQQ